MGSGSGLHLSPPSEQNTRVELAWVPVLLSLPDGRFRLSTDPQLGIQTTHNMKRLLITALVVSTLTLSSQAQNQVSYETFDYPAGSSLHQASGGSGWGAPWWSDWSGLGATVNVPGFDSTGGKMSCTAVWNGGYRQIDIASFPHLDAGGGLIGADGAVVWIAFSTVRPAGSNCEFGGVGLFIALGGEQMHLGSNWASFAWGVGGPGVGDTDVPGTSCDVLARLVYRIDFLPGDERLRMWVDPASDTPTSTPDIDRMVPDFTFNELGCRSGTNNYTFGYEFDNLAVYEGEVASGIGTSFCEGTGGICPCGNDNDGSLGSAGCANGSSPGGCALSGSGSASVSAGDLVLEAAGMVPSQPGLFFQGDNAINGGLGTPFGDGMRCAGGAVIRLEVIFGAADGTGATSIDIASKGGCAAGDVKRYQLWSRDPITSLCGANFNLSNGLEVTWGA